MVFRKSFKKEKIKDGGGNVSNGTNPEINKTTTTTSNKQGTRAHDNPSAVVVIVGGGPVGLITSLLLSEYGRRSNIEYNIHLYERRWKREADGTTVWKAKTDGNNRRGQVVTIQSNVWSLLPYHVKEALFNKNDKDSFIEMWPLGPDSSRLVGYPRNIPIKRIEDVLLNLLQRDGGDRKELHVGSTSSSSSLVSEVRQPMVTLHDEAFDNNTLNYAYDFIIMADGGASKTEQTFFPDAFGMRSNFAGIEPDFKDDVLGIFLKANEKDGDAFDVSLSESMAITVAQNRFLLNPLGKRRGFLNMWITKEEALEAVGDDGRCTQRDPCVFTRNDDTDEFRCPVRGNAFLPAAQGEESTLWRRIMDGLKLYGIPLSSVKSFTKFTLGPYYRRSNFLAPVLNKDGERAFAFVVGDAAMQVNFRAGRGLNTGIKSSVMLTRTLTNLLKDRRRRTQWHASLVEFEGFMSKMQEREVMIRTLLMMKGRGDSPDLDATAISHRMQVAFEEYKKASPGKRSKLENEAREDFYNTVSNIAKRSFSSTRLPDGINTPNLEEIRRRLDATGGETLFMLASCGAWNTEAAGGKEIGFGDVVEPIWDIPSSVDQSAAMDAILSHFNDPELQQRMEKLSETSTAITTATITGRDGPPGMRSSRLISKLQKLPFPERPEEIDVDRLVDNGFTKGLAASMVENSEAYPVRYFIIDNSGSMNKADGKKLVENMDGKSYKVVQCTRWEEISESILYHTTLSRLMVAPTIFRFLNDPRGKICQQFSVAARSADVTEIDKECKEVRRIMKKASPGGYTPLCDQIIYLTKTIKPMSDYLSANGQKAVVTIATDGMPTDKNGKSSKTVEKEFVELLRKLHNLPVWIVISLYTEDDDVISFYDELDMDLELSVDVIEGYFGEAKKVVSWNPWMNYGYALHQLREIGLEKRLFDFIDERKLTRSEVREFCCSIFGEEYDDSIPDPSSDWKGFISEIQHLNRTATKTYDPIKRKVLPWIDVRELERLYGDSSEEIKGLNLSPLFFCGLCV